MKLRLEPHYQIKGVMVKPLAREEMVKLFARKARKTITCYY
jgi:hypothetical protein